MRNTHLGVFKQLYSLPPIHPLPSWLKKKVCAFHHVENFLVTKRSLYLPKFSVMFVLYFNCLAVDDSASARLNLSVSTANRMHRSLCISCLWKKSALVGQECWMSSNGIQSEISFPSDDPLRLLVSTVHFHWKISALLNIFLLQSGLPTCMYYQWVCFHYRWLLIILPVLLFYKSRLFPNVLPSAFWLPCVTAATKPDSDSRVCCSSSAPCTRRTVCAYWRRSALWALRCRPGCASAGSVRWWPFWTRKRRRLFSRYWNRSRNTIPRYWMSVWL